MTEHELKQPRVMQWIKIFWPLVIAIFTVGVIYTSLTNADQMAKERMTAIELKQTADNQVQNQIQVQLSAIQVDIQWIKTRLQGKQ